MASVISGNCKCCNEVKTLNMEVGYFKMCSECIEKHKTLEMNATLDARRKYTLEERVALLEEELYKYKRDAIQKFEPRQVLY